MVKVKQEVEDKEYFKDVHFLYEILNSLKNLDEVKTFFKDILTPSELIMIKRRWHIANLLSRGHDIRLTAYKAKTSTQTVSKVKAILSKGNGGLEQALKRVNKRLEKEKKNYQESKKPPQSSNFIKKWF